LTTDFGAAEALPATLRETHDLRQRLGPPEKSSDGSVAIVRTLWDDAMEREPPDVVRQTRRRNSVDFEEGAVSLNLKIDTRGRRAVSARRDEGDLILETVTEIVPEKGKQSRRLQGGLLLIADLATDSADASWSKVQHWG